MRKIGIFSGTFDPVHQGHIEFALKAAEVANLGKVYFLPERQPRLKSDVMGYAKRLMILKAALHNHDNLGALEIDDINFTVAATYPKLIDHLPDAQLGFLMGSDTAYNLPNWPEINSIIKDCKFIIGVRAGHDTAELKEFLANKLPVAKFTIIPSPRPDVSSTKIRDN